MPPRSTELCKVDEEVLEPWRLCPYFKALDPPYPKHPARTQACNLRPRDMDCGKERSIVETLLTEHEAQAKGKGEENGPYDQARKPVKPGLARSQVGENPCGSQDEDKGRNHQNQRPVTEMENSL